MKINFSSSIYKDILLKSHVIEHTSFIRHSPSTNKMAVIIDPRYDKEMESVINNFMYFLNPNGWNLTIMSSPQYVSQIRRKYPFADILQFHESLMCDDSNITIQTYNRILLSKEFWNLFSEEHILIFQKDCVMFHMFDETKFLPYDFAGANVYVEKDQTVFNGMMNGGFSLRKRSAMLKCIETVDVQRINQHISKMKGSSKKYDSSLNEDVFFTFACEILHLNIPDIQTRRELSIEFEPVLYSPDFIRILKKENSPCPAVYHGWNKNYHSKQIATWFLQNSEYFSFFIEENV